MAIEAPETGSKIVDAANRLLIQLDKDFATGPGGEVSASNGADAACAAVLFAARVCAQVSMPLHLVISEFIQIYLSGEDAGRVHGSDEETN